MIKFLKRTYSLIHLFTYSLQTMADKPEAKQDSLGQLFVDIGIGGLGKTLKGLNSISASFLLGTKAASQFVQSVAKPFKEAGNTAIQIGKMSKALATTTTEFQKLSMHLKKYGLGDELLEDVSKLQTTLRDISTGYANIPSDMAMALQETKLNIMDYNGTFESTIKFLDDIQKRTSNMSKERRNFNLQRLGISSYWGYLWDKGGTAGNYYTVDTKNIEANEKFMQALNEFNATLQNFSQNVLAELTPVLTKFIDSMNEWVGHITGEKIKKGVNTASKVVAGGVVGAVVGGPFAPVAQVVIPVGAMQYEKNANSLGGHNIAPMGAPQIQVKDEDILPYKFKQWRAKRQGISTGGAADIFPEGAEIPPNISGMTQNITNNISHDMTINGNNAQEIAERIGAISAQDIQYTQYQASNLAGL